VRTDEETGQTVISGMGELHLEVLVDRMRREFAVDANVGKPQVAYRETVRKTVTKVEEKYVRQTGVRSVRPRRHHSGAHGPGGDTSSSMRSRAASSQGVHPAGQPGHYEALTSGVLAGTGCRRARTPHLRSYHDVDSSEMAFKIAGSIAVKKPRAWRARCCWSDHAVEVVTPRLHGRRDR